LKRNNIKSKVTQALQSIRLVLQLNSILLVVCAQKT